MPSSFPRTSFCAYGFDNASETLFFKTASKASRYGACECAPSFTPCTLDKVVSVTLLDGRHRLQSPRELSKTGDVAWAEAPPIVLWVTRHDGSPNAETEVFNLSTLENEVSSIVPRDFPSVVVLKSVIDYSSAFNQKNCMSFLAARMVDIVENMVLSNFLTRNRSQTYQRYIRAAKVFFLTPHHSRYI